MSRCIACNKPIQNKTYFCEDCLREQIGDPPRRRGPSLLSWLVLLPFHTFNFFVPLTQQSSEAHEWVAERAHLITTLRPQFTPPEAIDLVCQLAGFNSETLREQSLRVYRQIEFNQISVTKRGIERAPWDIVLQPGLQALMLVVAMLSLLVLIIRL